MARSLPCAAVLHAVAVDGFYQSSSQIVRAVVEKSLGLAASLGAQRVELTALATGYGRMSMAQFAEGIAPLIDHDFPRIEEIIMCVRRDDDKLQLEAGLSTHGCHPRGRF